MFPYQSTKRASIEEIRKSVLLDTGYDLPLNVADYIINDSAFYLFVDVEEQKNTVLNRLNRFWVYPLLFCIVLPPLYIIRGNWGLNLRKDAKIGKLFIKLVGQ